MTGYEFIRYVRVGPVLKEYDNIVNMNEYRKMINNMAGYVYFLFKTVMKREQAFVLQHRQVQLFF